LIFKAANLTELLKKEVFFDGKWQEIMIWIEWFWKCFWMCQNCIKKKGWFIL